MDFCEFLRKKATKNQLYKLLNMHKNTKVREMYFFMIDNCIKKVYN